MKKKTSKKTTHYQTKTIITSPIGNNALSFHKRQKKKQITPNLTIPSYKKITTTDDIQLGIDIVLEDIDHTGKLQSCKGLQHLYHYQSPTLASTDIIIMDNHNHALYFRLQHTNQHLNNQKKTQVLHIDAHADLGENKHIINPDKMQEKDNTDYLRKFTNHQCNIGNFITPYIHRYLPFLKERGGGGEDNKPVFQVRTSYALANISKQGEKDIDGELQTILDIDLDFRALEEKIPENELQSIHHIIETKNPTLITIATSPFFLDQKKAIQFLKQLLHHYKKIV